MKNASLNRESLKRYPRNSINLAYLYSSCSLTRLLSRSPEWTNISDKEKEKLGLTFEDDGDFWSEDVLTILIQLDQILNLCLKGIPL